MDTAAATALATRIAGRLTPELILSSPQYMNCVGKYEIDFRGNKLGAIENLGATEDQFDSMDFTDNAIVFLDGFPKLARLKVLLMNNNVISRIGRSLEDRIPNLEMLILTNNKIEALQERPSMQENDPAKERSSQAGSSKSSKAKGPTPEQITAIKAAIQNAGCTYLCYSKMHGFGSATLEEVRQLEAALKSGIIPTQLQTDTDTMATGEEDVEMTEDV